MIVKVPKARQDGGSSFEDLEAYITEGIEQSSERTQAGNIERLTQYITKDSVLNALGEDVEKTIAVETGNVTSLDAAAGEMRAAASFNNRVTNPTLHYILSWPEKEVPDTQSIFQAARASLRALGMLDHQYIIAIHGNTDNIHAHIAVNRVHPVTYKAARLEWLHKTLHKAAREIEIEHGWSHDNGLFKVVEVNGKKHVIPNNEYVDPELTDAKGAAASFETWAGEQSLETWCKGAPAKSLKAVLENKSISSWQDIHRDLALFGLELRDSGGSGMRVHVVDDPSEGRATKKELSVSASKAFRFMKRPDLEARLGNFVPSQKDFSDTTSEKTYKRDPLKRLDRKLERRALRDALHKQFIEDQKARRQTYEIAKREIRNAFSTSDTERRNALENRYRLERAAIKADITLPRQQKQQAYMLARLSVIRARHQLKEQHSAEKIERKALLPALITWREWVEEHALTGDEAAISALRGMVYQEKRDGKLPALGAIEDTSENAIRPVAPSFADPLARKIPALTWTVHRNGTVAYNFKNGSSGFIDAGEKLVFGRSLVSDEALALTLQYAQDKWKGELKITGGDAVFKARVARIANQLGIALQNPDLKALQAQIRTQTPMQQGASKPTLTKMKEKKNDEPRYQNKQPDGVPPAHRRDSLHHLSASYLVLDTSGDVGLLRKNVSDRLAKQEAGIDHGMQRSTRSNSGITSGGGIDISQTNELSIELRVLQLVPNADIQHAITQSKRYSGKIVAENAQYLAQATSKDKIVLHEKKGFGSDMPKVGDTATIAYQSGKPIVKIRVGKTR